MASYVDLDTLVGFGEEADAALAKVVRAVMQANAWRVTGNATFKGGPTGYALHVPLPPGAVLGVTTSTFGLRSGNQLAGGTIQVQSLDADGAVTDDEESPAWNNAKNAEGGIDTGLDVIALPVRGGQYVIIWVECTAP